MFCFSGRKKGSLVDGPRADQMETEKASHEAEESLSIAPFGVTHPQTDKLQNGSPSPDVGPPLQLNGDAAWGHFKPTNGSGLGVNPMKRHRENCSSPVTMQGLSDQTGVYAMNGEIKHSLSEQPQLGPHQPKRPRAVELQVNGNDEMKAWQRTESGRAESGDYEGNNAVQDGKLDSKRHFNLSNGDIFSRSKSVPISNGAIETPSSMVGSTGDLLEKTLSQYYPEQVSIAPQTGQSQAEREVQSGVGSERPEQNTQSPSLTSGFPISSSQMPVSEQQARISPELHDGNGGYNTQFMVNGFSSSFGGEHHQHPQHPQQQQQQQQQPLPDITDLEEAHTLDQAPGMVTPQRVSPGSQAQNGSECFPSNPEGPSIFSKSNTEFKQGPYLPSLDSNTPLHTNKGGGFRPFSSSGGPPSTPKQYGAQQQQQKPSLPCPAEHSTLQGTSGIPSPGMSNDREPEPQAGPTPMQGQRGKLESELSLSHTQGMSQRAEACSQIGWIDLNSQASTQSAGMPTMWGGFSPQPSVDQHPPPSQQNQGQSHDPSSTQGFLAQGFNASGYQKQQQDCQTHDWQQRGSKPSPTGPLPGPPKLQHMPQQCSLPPQQADNQFCAQQEHLCKDQDLEQILSPNFMPPHQQPLLPPHPQHEGHQATNALQRQRSQDSPSNTTPQPSDSSQGPLDPELLNRLKMENYMRSEKQQQQLNSPTYRSQPGPSPQPISSPSHRPKTQLQQNDQAMFGFGSADNPPTPPHLSSVLAAGVPSSTTIICSVSSCP